MEGITNEIRNKIKWAVKAKLQEIDAYVDEELPDYIMVMIANRRSKAQMKSELSLFLGSSTDNFTDWLHSVLERLEAFAMTNNTTDKLKEAVSSVPKTGNSTAVSAEVRNTPSLSIHPEQMISSEPQVVIKKENLTEEFTSANPIVPQALHGSSTAHENPLVEDMEDDCLNIGDVPDQDFQGNDLSTRRTSRRTVMDNASYSKRRGSRLDDRVPKKPRQDENNRRRRDEGRIQSRIFSVVRPILSQSKSKTVKDNRDDVSKDGELDGGQKSSVNSVVRVTSRRKLPASLQPTKKLILKAVADAQKSVIANPPKVAEPEEKPMPALYTRKYRERQQKTKSTMSDSDDVMQQLRDTNAMEIDEDEHGISTLQFPSHQRIAAAVVTGDELEPYEEPNVSQISLVDDEPQIEPRFIVTLDGAHSILSRRFDHVPIEDDEVELRDAPIEKKSIKSRLYRRRSTGTEVDVSKPLERCKFWPSCRQGDACPFHHPKTPCKAFPNCTYGEGCLFVHPQCKFDAACSRKSCPFSHTLRSQKNTPSTVVHSAKSSPATLVNGKVVCKFYPTCNNVNCQFFHPAACKYGTNCTRMGCTFYHPSAFPAKNKLKWVPTTK